MTCKNETLCRTCGQWVGAIEDWARKNGSYRTSRHTTRLDRPDKRRGSAPICGGSRVQVEKAAVRSREGVAS